MFDGIVAKRARCGHCGKDRMLAGITELARDVPFEGEPDGAVIWLCAGCIYKLVRLAGLLLKLEAAPKKKAPRKPKAARRSAAALPPLGPFDRDEALEPEGNRSRMP